MACRIVIMMSSFLAIASPPSVHRPYAPDRRTDGVVALHIAQGAEHGTVLFCLGNDPIDCVERTWIVASASASGGAIPGSPNMRKSPDPGHMAAVSRGRGAFRGLFGEVAAPVAAERHAGVPPCRIVTRVFASALPPETTQAIRPVPA